MYCGQLNIRSKSTTLTPKGHMVFFEFRSGSHFLSLFPNFLLFLGLGAPL